MATLLDGKAHAARVREGLAAVTANLAEDGLVPGLHVLLIGDDPASSVYVRSKARMAAKVGIRSEVTRLPVGVDADAVFEQLARLNDDPTVDGVLVQLPLPDLPTRAILDAVAPDKDVDGFSAHNAGLLSQRRPRFVPCTPLGVLSLLDHHGVELAGREALVIGRSDIVGRPMATLLTHRNATVTVAHSRTADLRGHLARAEVVVVAMGRERAIDPSWIRPGAVVVDVGIHRMADGKLTGDVHPDGLAERAGAWTPVPGGVGPMTIAMLLVNTTLAALERRGAGREPLAHLVPEI